MTLPLDIGKIKPWLLSWLLAALIYDENRIADYVTGLLGLKCHFEGSDGGAEFFGIVIDERRGHAYLPYRGTDGYDPRGNLVSWAHNFDIKTSGDGVEDGFQKCGDIAFNRFKHYLYNVDTASLQGHSKGGGVVPYEACLCAENLPNLKSIVVHPFANPPTGNALFERRFNGHVAAGKISGDRRILPGDPIASKLFRLRVPPLNGVDVLDLIELPKIVRYKMGPANVLNHSCCMYNASIAVQVDKDATATWWDHSLPGIIHDRLVN